MLTARVRSRRLVLAERPMPRVPPGWALIHVRLAGFCNTDLEILRGYHNFRGTLGHEFVGEVAACGGAGAARRAAEKRWLGRRVVGEINIACRALGLLPVCTFCRRGIPTHCARRRVVGILNQDGAFAEYLALPLVNLHSAPEGLADDCAVFTEPLAAACQILAQVPIPRGETVAVLGDGKLGQLIVRVLSAVGGRVVLYERHREKLALATRPGISTIFLRRGRKAPPPSGLRRFPIVVDATGVPDGLALATRMTEPRGTLVLKSTFHGAARLETWPIVVDEMTVVGSRCGPFSRALALLASGRVDPRPLISGVFPLREAPDAIREARAPGVLKVQLDPRA